MCGHGSKGNHREADGGRRLRQSYPKSGRVQPPGGVRLEERGCGAEAGEQGETGVALPAPYGAQEMNAKREWPYSLLINRVVAERMGGKTLGEIGAPMGRSKEWVRQIIMRRFPKIGRA